MGLGLIRKGIADEIGGMSFCLRVLHLFGIRREYKYKYVSCRKASDILIVTEPRKCLKATGRYPEDRYVVCKSLVPFIPSFPYIGLCSSFSTVHSISSCVPKVSHLLRYTSSSSHQLTLAVFTLYKSLAKVISHIISIP